MEFPVFSKSISLDKMQAYMGAHRDNIHTDPEIAERVGLRGAVAQGGHLATILNELMVRTFGEEFLNGGSISVNFIKLVRPGDTVTPRAKILESAPASEGGTALDLEVWLENQRGDIVTIGKAKVVTQQQVAT